MMQVRLHYPQLAFRFPAVQRKNVIAAFDADPTASRPRG
jgi:hypothetical protein